jgi:hypothetical protein
MEKNQKNFEHKRIDYEKTIVTIYLARIKYRKIIFWAFLLASQRSRRATGYAIASVLTHFAAQTLRMPNAKEVFFMGGSCLPTHPPPS